ncbi:hypothetical protein LTR78_010349 [Recurvomyces mirabilis]|uniref:Enoyl reductase (ER) domain-containing protein n=1 Tax=Recurvomyces mirabilis TaxID=574656 RepID=A0AAE0TPW7_9PEZI|nr:hypothetical protein LTR78_010349 [Recurvomyces mirabilis]KAK5156211.1 hypothetical protein LTS14_005098 [Recurvomyces mirabilis]
MKAITATRTKAHLSTLAIPTLTKPTDILVRVATIALNPTDWKHIAFSISQPNSIAGCDFAGTVVAIGSGVTKALEVGNRVAGAVHGGKTGEGCFAEYCLAKGDLVVKIPDEMSFEKAATFPLGVATVGQGLFQQGLMLPLPSPSAEGGELGKQGTGEWVLVYSGSTATGSLAIQFAKLSGCRVLTTCSPANFSFVKSLGADEIFDYSIPGIGQQINRFTENSLRLIFDAIGSEESAAVCAKVMSSRTEIEGKRYATIIGPPAAFEEQKSVNVKVVVTMMYTIFGEDMSYFGSEVSAVPADLEFGKKWMGLVEGLLREGLLKTHPERVGEKGLEGALQGMLDMRDEKVRAVKLVYRVAETPADSMAEMELGEDDET